MKRKKLFKLIMRCKIWFGIAMIFTFLEALTTYYFPQFLQKIIDIVIPTNDLYRLKELIAFIVFLEVLSLTSTLIINYIFAHISNQFVLNLKMLIIKQSFLFKRKDIAEKESTILTIMNTDVYYIQAIISKVIPQVIIDIFSVVAVFIVLYQIQPIILYVIIIVYPTLVILQILFNKKIAKASRTAMNAIDKSNNLLQEYLKYMFDYISMNAHDYFMNKYFDSENQVFSSKLKLDLLNSYNSLVPTSINSFTLIIMILFCSMYIINGMMSISGLTIFIMYINKLFNPILRLMMTFGEFQKIKVSMQRINSILEVEE